MKIWVNGRKLKCTEKGCKKKHAYTLEYTKHRDEHSYVGLNCAICNRPQPGPADYAAHMAAEHPTELSLQVSYLCSQCLAPYILSTSNKLGRIQKIPLQCPLLQCFCQFLINIYLAGDSTRGRGTSSSSSFLPGSFNFNSVPKSCHHRGWGAGQTSLFLFFSFFPLKEGAM